jgi:hypothetical protein
MSASTPVSACGNDVGEQTRALGWRQLGLPLRLAAHSGKVEVRIEQHWVRYSQPRGGRRPQRVGHRGRAAEHVAPLRDHQRRIDNFSSLSRTPPQVDVAHELATRAATAAAAFVGATVGDRRGTPDGVGRRKLRATLEAVEVRDVDGRLGPRGRFAALTRAHEPERVAERRCNTQRAGAQHSTPNAAQGNSNASRSAFVALESTFTD